MDKEKRKTLYYSFESIDNGTGNKIVKGEERWCQRSFEDHTLHFTYSKRSASHATLDDQQQKALYTFLFSIICFLYIFLFRYHLCKIKKRNKKRNNNKNNNRNDDDDEQQHLQQQQQERDTDAANKKGENRWKHTHGI